MACGEGGMSAASLRARITLPCYVFWSKSRIFFRVSTSIVVSHLWKVTLNLFLRNFFFCTPFCTAFFAAVALVAAALLSASAMT